MTAIGNKRAKSANSSKVPSGGEPGEPVRHERSYGRHGHRRDRVGPPGVREGPVEDLVLRPDERAEVPPTDDLGRTRQRAGRLLEQVLATFDEGAAVVRQHEPHPHPLVPHHRADGPHRLVGGIGIHVPEVAQGDRRQRPGREGRHTTTASIPRCPATATTSAARSPGVAELW